MTHTLSKIFITMTVKANPSLTPHDAAHHPAPSRFAAYWFYLGYVALAMASAAVLVGTCARAQPVQLAQSTQSTPPAEPADLAPAPEVVKPEAPKAAPKYSAKDVERVFAFIDANKDNKISREEASGFRNIAKYFDAADTNKDNSLSFEEFGNALNR